LESTATGGRRSPANFYDGVRQAKRDLILKALEQAKGNYTEAANALGMHPNNLHRLIRSLDLKSAIAK
jgi:transcriptional regulator with GAF, ATPase, and Fis domain